MPIQPALAVADDANINDDGDYQQGDAGNARNAKYAQPHQGSAPAGVIAAAANATDEE